MVEFMDLIKGKIKYKYVDKSNNEWFGGHLGFL